MIPEKFVDRVETIETYQEDGSAQARLGAWKTAWAVALARPLTGGGFQIIDDHRWGRFYNPEHASGHGGVHSIYLEILAENGFITFGVYLLLLLSSILSATKIKRRSLESDLQNFHCYGAMLGIAFVAFAVSGAFLEFASFDLFYHLVAITIVLKVLLREKIRGAQDEATPDGFRKDTAYI